MILDSCPVKLKHSLINAAALSPSDRSTGLVWWPPRARRGTTAGSEGRGGFASPTCNNNPREQPAASSQQPLCGGQRVDARTVPKQQHPRLRETSAVQ